MVGNVTNVQHESNWNFHYEIPLYHEYILIKTIFLKKYLGQKELESNCLMGSGFHLA
jgi:hypothetical protein